MSGIPHTIQYAFNNYTNHEASLIKMRNTSFQYPEYPKTFLLERDKIEDIQDDIRTSDLLVFKEHFKILFLPKIFGIERSLLRKKRIVSILGRAQFMRGHINRIMNRYIRVNNDVRFMATGIDYVGKDISWVPPCTTVDEHRKNYDYSNKLIPPLILTTPSRDTDLFCGVSRDFHNVVHRIKNWEQYRVQVIAFNISNAQCLETKAKASIFFDRFHKIYGVNSHEAGAFECGVITGCSRVVLNRLAEEGFYCPFLIANNVKTATKCLSDLLDDEGYRKDIGKACYRFVKQVHSGEESVKRILEAVE